MSDSDPVVVWFRQDLRLADNPALTAAAATGRAVVPLYVLDDDTPGPWKPGGASRWWLYHSLAALDCALRAAGSQLVLRRGNAAAVVPAAAREAGATRVAWNRCDEPFAIRRDDAIAETLRASGIAAESFNAALLFEPWTVKTGSGGPYRVFTPFWRACLAAPAPQAPLPKPRRLAAPKRWPSGERLGDWRLKPTRPDWAAGFATVWQPGEEGARARLRGFVDQRLARYADGRDRPADEATARLSPHLHFGEIGPRQVWHAVRGRETGDAAAKFLSEIGWREFAHHLLFHFPEMPMANLRDGFERFPWRSDAAALRAWQCGRTGYPTVDAGMRELWRTGWMHNRVRMIAASFLVKHLLIDWREGARWFWDTLVDADLANNSAGWQWVAGTGADAAPFFRIFNPVTQGEKFDAGGAYVRCWVPEIARLPDRWLHRPWAAPADVLANAGVRLGETYPAPIVDHGQARKRALAALYGRRRGC